MDRIYAGVDWIGYTEYYKKDYSEMLTRGDIEYGYIIFMYFVKKVGLNYYQFQFLISLLTSLCIYKFYKNNARYSLLCIYIYINLYYLRYNMGLQRQLIALSICLLSYELSKKNSRIYIWICFLSSISFHFSAIIYWGIFFSLKFIKINMKTQIILMNITFILTLLKINLVKPLIKILIMVSEFMNLKFISNKISVYVGNEFYSGNVGITKSFLLQFLIIMIIFLFRKPRTMNEKKIYLLTSIYVVVTLLSSMFYVLDRLQIYFAVFSIILMSYLLDFFKNKLIIFLCLELFFLYPIINFVLHNETRYYLRYTPYYNVFFKVNNETRWKAELGLIGEE